MRCLAHRDWGRRQAAARLARGRPTGAAVNPAAVGRALSRATGPVFLDAVRVRVPASLWLGGPGGNEPHRARSGSSKETGPGPSAHPQSRDRLGEPEHPRRPPETSARRLSTEQRLGFSPSFPALRRSGAHRPTDSRPDTGSRSESVLMARARARGRW